MIQRAQTQWAEFLAQDPAGEALPAVVAELFLALLGFRFQGLGFRAPNVAITLNHFYIFHSSSCQSWDPPFICMKRGTFPSFGWLSKLGSLFGSRL